ncbi:MAG: hypothetical protein ACR2ML_14015 [Solirubrobacteraceae bacterium]
MVGHHALGLQCGGQAHRRAGEAAQHAVVRKAAEFVDLLASHTPARPGCEAYRLRLHRRLIVEPGEEGDERVGCPRRRRVVLLAAAVRVGERPLVNLNIERSGAGLT